MSNNSCGVFGISQEDLQHANSNTEFISQSDTDYDFVQILPPELSNKLFNYLPDKDIFSCAKCSISWQKVINNNSQWKLRCIRRGWASRKSGKDIAEKWNSVKSHVSPFDSYKFRTSPAFILSPIASLRISPLCLWAVYFRQCLHLERNWNRGIYTIHRLHYHEDNESTAMNNFSDCDGRILVTGTSDGKVYIWSLQGVPQFITCIPFRKRVEVEVVKIVANYLIILYQVGNIKVYNIENLLSINFDHGHDEPVKLNLAYEMRGIGNHIDLPDHSEFELNIQEVESQIPDEDFEEEEADDVELWIRDLFRVDLWLGNDPIGSDMMIYSNSEWVVLTGLLCKYFIIWDLHTGKRRRKIPLKSGFQITYQSFMSSRKLYLPTKKRSENGGVENFTSYVLVYDLLSLENEDISMINVTEIPSEYSVEDIRPDINDKRIAFSTQAGTLYGILLKEGSNYDANNNQNFEVLFMIHATTFVDNLTISDSVIVFHQYDGFLVALNWSGEQLYEVEAHIGLVKGLQIYDNFLVSGGDAMQLYVWNATTGEKLHTVHHQPCRIENVFVDSTKIVTIGREDAPVVVAYW